MKTKFFILLIGLMMVFSLSSCDVYTYATTQDDIYIEAQADVVHSDVDFNIVIRYGTPYYYNGTLLYYLYNNLYYYPFYYDNYWYVRAYRRPFNHLNYRPYFRPNRHDYRFAPGVHHGFDRPNNLRPNNSGFRHRPNNRRPDVQPNRPPVNNKPHTMPRPDVNRNQQPVQPRRSVTPTRGTNNQPSRGGFGGSRNRR